MKNSLVFDNSNDSRLKNPIKVAMANNHLLLTKGISLLLKDYPEISLCATFLNPVELLNWYTGINADVLLIDFQMQKFNGMDISMKLLKIFPSAKIIALSIDEINSVPEIKKMGVRACHLKNTDSEEFINSIKLVNSDNNSINRSGSGKGVKSIGGIDASAKLSSREIEIVKFIVLGKTNKQMAEQLNLSHLTVKTHRQNLMRKLKISKVAQLIKTAQQYGYLNY